MKQKCFGLISLVLVFVLFAFSLSACGAKGLASDSIEENKAEGMEEGSSSSSDAEILDPSFSEGAQERKIIERIGLTLQTKSFDSLLADIEDQVASLGGYVENAEIFGRKEESDEMRRATLTVRIPAEKSGGFSDFVSENAVVINRSVSTEDVTLKYVDTESRVMALKLEKAALEQLLKDGATVEEIISVREKLTDVIYQIESYESQLRAYDNLVDYTTVSLSIREVERTVVVEKQGVWQKIGTNMKENFIIVSEILVDGFVLLISSIPFLLLLAVFVVIFICMKRICKKQKNRKKQIKEEKNLPK